MGARRSVQKKNGTGVTITAEGVRTKDEWAKGKKK